ncbi:hypothetical protein SAMN05444388_10531 [Flavobacterium johnsoniae]|uniref:Lipoprotein n=1 Tax=Flavobacterium johnsoniae TaxID=986 RepID=A0A1M5NJ75_FLAJO|nr:hypothetical protein SAMN05444388_10531 [Flavobacterium johnsoniae]
MKTTKMVCLFIIIIALSACKKDAKGKNDNYTTVNKNAASSECLAPANWFTMVNNTRQTPPPDSSAKRRTNKRICQQCYGNKL